MLNAAPAAPMLTVADLAKRFDVTPSAVSNWIRRYGPKSPAPLPLPDDPAPNPKWRADRWPEFERWIEQRKRIRRGPKPKPTRRSVADNPMSMNDVLVAVGAVVAHSWEREQFDFDDQDDDGKVGHVFNHLTVLTEFLVITGANAASTTHPRRSGERNETDESAMLTITQLAAELGVTKASVHGWYVSTALPVRFPRPVVDPPKVEGQRRGTRQWSRAQLPEARAWLLWYRQHRLRNLASVSPDPNGAAVESTSPAVSEFLKDTKRGTRSGVRHGRIARNNVRKLYG